MLNLSSKLVIECQNVTKQINKQRTVKQIKKKVRNRNGDENERRKKKMKRKTGHP